MSRPSLDSKPARISLKLWGATALLLLTLAWIPGVLRAQLMLETRAADESVHIAAGSVFEIKAETDGQAALVSWVLTRERAFVEAGREQFFRVRLTQPGIYLLEAAADFPDSGQRVRKNILLDVKQSDGAGGDAAGSVRTAPANIGGIVALPEGMGIITLIPSPATEKPIGVDADTSTDSSGDGENANDNDAGDALFSTEGNPLAFWFVFPRERSMKIRSGAREQSIAVQTGASPAVPVATGNIVARDVGGGDILFSYETGTFPDNIVHQWNFGDGRQSMIRNPSHRYFVNGNYDVKVMVRDLQSGTLAGEAAMTVAVTSVPDATQTGAVLPDPGKPDPKPETPGEPILGGMLPLLLRIAVVGLLAIGLGALAMWIVSKILRRTRGGLQKTLADVEAKLSTDGKKSGTAPATLELRRPEAVPEVVEKPAAKPAPEETPVAAPAPTPPPTDFVDVNKAPAWLKQGLQAEKPEVTEPTPPPPPPVFEAPQPPAEQPVTEPQAAPLTGVFSPEPAPVMPPAAPAAPEPVMSGELTPLPSEQDMLPPWMQNDGSALGPQPEPIVETPLPNAAPVPAPAVTDTPAWLQPQTPATPAPEPARTPVPDPVPATPAPIPAPMPEPIPAISQPEPAPVPTTPEPSPAPTPIIPTLDPGPAAAVIPPAQSFTNNVPPASVVTAPVTPPVAISTPAPATQTAQKTQDQLKREEAERERKRRKRQRYRENLKKRTDEEKKNSTPIAPNPSPAPARVPATEQKMIKPVAPIVQKPKPTPTVPVVTSPAPAAPITPTSVTAPAPVPVPQDIPPAESPIAPAQKSDDSVVFEIKAEGLGDQKPNNVQPRAK